MLALTQLGFQLTLESCSCSGGRETNKNRMYFLVALARLN